MEAKFIKYLESIGIIGALQDKIANIMTFYTDICSYKIDDIFVSEYLKEDGTREYETIWLFSNQVTMEAKLLADNYDATIYKKKIIRWEINKTDYDFNNANDKSRMSLDLIINPSVGGLFKASKSNCDHLVNILKKYIIPNMEL